MQIQPCGLARRAQRAFFINAAILIVAAAAFFKTGTAVTELQQAHSLLSPLPGTTLAGLAFAVGLVCAGQASTLTGTLAGQIVMEGLLHFKIRPFLRRLLTRLLAVIPAVLTIIFMGDKASYQLLILSQVVLSMQIPFAIIPLIHFTRDRESMGELANPAWLNALAWAVALVILGLNGKLVVEQLQEWIAPSPSPALIYVPVFPIIAGLVGLLLYITLKPFIHLPRREAIPAWRRLSHFVRAEEDSLDLDVPRYHRIGVALAFHDDDRKVLSHALPLARQHDSALCLFHVVEGPAGTVFGPDAYDTEAREDEAYLTRVAVAIGHKGSKWRYSWDSAMSLERSYA